MVENILGNYYFTNNKIVFKNELFYFQMFSSMFSILGVLFTKMFHFLIGFWMLTKLKKKVVSVFSRVFVYFFREIDFTEKNPEMKTGFCFLLKSFQKNCEIFSKNVLSIQ